MKDRKNYKPSDIAKMFSVHSNTVRLYEKLGFLSEAPRNENGYRVYTEIHVSQMRICRCIFGYSFSNRRIRKCGRDILFASASQDWTLTREKTIAYINVIEQELTLADETVDIIKEWLSNLPSTYETTSDTLLFSRKDLADMLHVTLETIRNWDRNGMIKATQTDEKGRVLYDSLNRDKAKMVYLLLQCSYSMSAIYKALYWGTRGQIDKAIVELETPDYQEFLSAGDSWRKELKKILHGANQILPILEGLEKETTLH